MKTSLKTLVVGLFLVMLFGQALAQDPQFGVRIDLQWGPKSDSVVVGVNGGSTTPLIQEGSYGLDDVALGIYGPFGRYGESSGLGDPDGNRVSIRDVAGHTEIQAAGRLATYDYRAFTSSTQSDTFIVQVEGPIVEANNLVVTWPASTVLDDYADEWWFYPAATTATPTTSFSPSGTRVNMLGGATTATISAAATVRFAIVKVGARVPSPGPTFSLAPTSLNFGTVNVGSSSTQSVTVTNNGILNNLRIDSVRSLAGYSVAPNPPGGYPITVLPGASRTFDVTFTPTSGATFAGNIVFFHNAGGSTNLAVTGDGRAQGGVLTFASGSRTRFDNTPGYPDSLTMNYAGQPLKALQLRIIMNGLLIVRSVSRGGDLPSPAWSFSSVIARGPANVDGSSNDTIKVVAYGNGSTALGPGSYNSIVRFEYDVVNIDNPDVQSTTIGLADVLGSLGQGEDAFVTAGPAQNITVNNRTQIGDVNDDGRIDILDLLLIVDHILNRITLTGLNFSRADVAPFPTGNTVINVQDLALLQWIILNNQYPGGAPISKPSVPPTLIAGDGPKKLNPGVDAKLTFHLTLEGIAIRLENAKPVKGIQAEFGHISTVADPLNITTALGQGFGKVTNQVFRVLLYNQLSEVVPPGDRIVANIPCGLVNPAEVTLENLVVAGEDNKALNKVESELSLTASAELPTEYALSQNYPNPFNPTTNITFSVPQLSDVRISIYNLLGQEIRTLFAGQMDRGTRVVGWDGRDNRGKSVSSGTYIYRMTAGSFVESRKMMLLK